MASRSNQKIYDSTPPPKRIKLKYLGEPPVEDDIWWMTNMSETEANQLVRAIYENTMNTLKECSNRSLMGPDPDHSVEVAAVSMAIRSHGLACPDEEAAASEPPTTARLPQPSSSTAPSDDIFCNDNLERDKILSEAVAVAIQNKGLGALASDIH